MKKSNLVLNFLHLAILTSTTLLTLSSRANTDSYERLLTCRNPRVYIDTEVGDRRNFQLVIQDHQLITDINRDSPLKDPSEIVLHGSTREILDGSLNGPKVRYIGDLARGAFTANDFNYFLGVSDPSGLFVRFFGDRRDPHSSQINSPSETFEGSFYSVYRKGINLVIDNYKIQKVGCAGVIVPPHFGNDGELLSAFCQGEDNTKLNLDNHREIPCF